jgi:hypothetical protein
MIVCHSIPFSFDVQAIWLMLDFRLFIRKLSTSPESPFRSKWIEAKSHDFPTGLNQDFRACARRALSHGIGGDLFHLDHVVHLLSSDKSLHWRMDVSKSSDHGIKATPIALGLRDPNNSSRRSCDTCSALFLVA